jgi:uncharacterized protein YdiU (UPF0061 family)
MNTDNLSIIGQTIDYGPYGWIENFDEDWTPNTTDAQNKRYRFGNQASIALWNLNKLANALFPLIEEAAPLEKSLNFFKDYFIENHTLMLYAKLGISNEENFDDSFMNELFELLTQAEIDMTIFYRNLTKFDTKNTKNFYLEIQKTSYLNEPHLEQYKTAWIVWLNKYADKLKNENTNTEDRIAAMNLINPKYVLRNYMAQLAIEAAEKEDYKLIHELYSLLKNPYSEQVDNEKWFAKRPNWALDKVGCSQLSCSS